jgi:hypothetical protein
MTQQADIAWCGTNVACPSQTEHMTDVERQKSLSMYPTPDLGVNIQRSGIKFAVKTK